jgi:hypothetical protein
MEQKKLYVTPEETVVEIKMQQHLLAGSGGDSITTPTDDARVLDFTDTEELN